MKKRVILTILVVLLLGAFTTASALSPQRKPPKVRHEIEMANEIFMAAIAEGDAEALAQMYTEDAVLMVPNVETFEGRAEIQAFWEGFFASGIDSALLEIRDVDALGNTAVEVSNYTLYMGDVDVDHGKYMVEWKRVKGEWYLRWDIFNSSRPAP